MTALGVQNKTERMNGGRSPDIKKDKKIHTSSHNVGSSTENFAQATNHHIGIGQDLDVHKVPYR